MARATPTFTPRHLAAARRMGARAGDTWVRYRLSLPAWFTGVAGLEPLARAWQDAYAEAARKARAEQARKVRAIRARDRDRATYLR